MLRGNTPSAANIRGRPLPNTSSSAPFVRQVGRRFLRQSQRTGSASRVSGADVIEGLGATELLEQIRTGCGREGGDKAFSQLVDRSFVVFSSALAVSRCFCATGYMSAAHSLIRIVTALSLLLERTCTSRIALCGSGNALLCVW